jgi:hypothetical protein
MMLLKNIKDVNLFISSLDKCSGTIILRSIDGTEEFNLKSKLSQYIAIGRLCEEHGDEYEIFCYDKTDEAYMLSFFRDLNK